MTVLNFILLCCFASAVEIVNAKHTAYFIVPKDTSFQYPASFQNLSKDYIQIKAVTHETWGIKNKFDTKIYFVLIRDDKYYLINEVYNPLKDKQYIQKMYEARFTCITKISSLELPDFMQKQPKFFIMYSPTFNIEYDSLAFANKDYKVPFVFINGTFSVQMIDTRYNATIKKRMKESLKWFVDKNIDTIPILKQDSIYIVTDNRMDDAINIMSYISNVCHIPVFIYNWRNFEELRQIAQVSPSELSIFYLTFNENKVSKIYMFPDEDVYSNELLNSFISKAYTKKLDPVPISVTLPINDHVNMIYDIGKKVPSKNKYVVVYFKSKNSYDNLDATLLVYDVAKLGFGPNVVFYMTDPSVINMPWFVPTLDDFPMIVMWKPNDFRPFVYSDIFKLENIERWIREMTK